MKANYTLHKAQSQLSELLMELDCDWDKEKVSDKTDEHPEQYKFTAKVGKHKIIVAEKHVGFASLTESSEGEFEDTRLLGDGKKYSQLYKALVRRFDEDSDIKFYDKVFEDITTMLEAQEQEEQEDKEQDDDRTLPLLDSREN